LVQTPTRALAKVLHTRIFRLNGAAQESNLPSAGLRRRTGFEDQGRCVASLVFGSAPCSSIMLDHLRSAPPGKSRAKVLPPYDDEGAPSGALEDVPDDDTG
jgi:hypothetical protein